MALKSGQGGRHSNTVLGRKSHLIILVSFAFLAFLRLRIDILSSDEATVVSGRQRSVVIESAVESVTVKSVTVESVTVESVTVDSEDETLQVVENLSHRSHKHKPQPDSNLRTPDSHPRTLNSRNSRSQTPEPCPTPHTSNPKTLTTQAPNPRTCPKDAIPHTSHPNPKPSNPNTKLSNPTLKPQTPTLRPSQTPECTPSSRSGLFSSPRLGRMPD